MKILTLFVVGLTLVAPVWAGGEGEKSAATGSTLIPIRLVGKDFSPSVEENVNHLNRIEESIRESVGLSLDIELVQMPEGSYAEKLNLMLLSGNIPDIIYFQGNDEAIANQGMLADLTPYLASSQVMQKAMLDFNKKRLESYPFLIWLAPPRIRVPLVRSDWFEKAGGSVPETVDDYYAMLSKFVRNDYDGNGKVDSIGITDTGNTDRIDFIFNHAFGITSTWIKQGGRFVYSRVTEAEKNKLAFYRELYEEGILDPEYITTKWDTMEDKLFSAKVGMIGGTMGIIVDIYENKMKKSAAGGSLVALPPAAGVGRGFSVDVTKETRGWALSAGGEYKQEAWTLLEFMATDEGQYLDRLGFEGIHHTKQDNSITLTDKFSEWWPRFHEVVEWEAPVRLLGPNAQKSMDIAVAHTKEDINFVIPREYAPTWDALNNLYHEYSFKLISGEYPMKRFEEFATQWNEMGGDKLAGYANEVLNR